LIRHTSADMVRRYVLASLVVFGVAFVVAIALYLHQSVSYVSSCRFRMQPAPTSTQSTSDYFAFASMVAAREVSLAQSSAFYEHVSASSGIPTGQLIDSTKINPGASGAYFLAQVTDSDADRAARAANGVCGEITSQIKAQRAAEQKDETDALSAELVNLFQTRATLTAQPPSQAGQAQVTSLDKAITGVETQLAQSQALPPDLIQVLDRAGPGARNDDRSLSRNLLIALVAGLLGSFLIVLIGEALADRTRPTAPQPSRF